MEVGDHGERGFPLIRHIPLPPVQTQYSSDPGSQTQYSSDPGSQFQTHVQGSGEGYYGWFGEGSSAAGQFQSSGQGMDGDTQFQPWLGEGSFAAGQFQSSGQGMDGDTQFQPWLGEGSSGQFQSPVGRIHRYAYWGWVGFFH